MSTAADLAARAHAARVSGHMGELVSTEGLRVAWAALEVDDPDVRAAAQAVLDHATRCGQNIERYR